MWLLWALLAGTPLGPLALLAAWEEPSLVAFASSAAASGVLLAGAVALLARRGHYEPERGRHLARAASAALLSLPALGAVLLGLPPAAPWLAILVVALLAAALARAVRVGGPAAPVPRHALVAAGALLAFSLALVLLGGALSAWGGAQPVLDEELARATWEVDARVPLRPEPACAPTAARTQVLLDRGAHPQLSADGGWLWFDGQGPDGRRQVHVLERASGTARCATCDEAGNNRRPAPSPLGGAVVFDTDRHATCRRPNETELHVMAVGADGRARASRRVTWAPGPDDHALYDPSGRGLVWSRETGRDFAVVRAGLRSGHGGLFLGGERVLAAGGTRWIAPLAWSPDARSLATGRGHWLRPLDATLLDPATGERLRLGGVAGFGAVSFSADGTWMAVATTRPSGAASLLPEFLGFLLGRLRPLVEASDRAGPGVTEVRVGAVGAPLEAVALGEAGAWGEPTGIALAPDATGFALAQRRDDADGPQERIVWVALACEKS